MLSLGFSVSNQISFISIFGGGAESSYNGNLDALFLPFRKELGALVTTYINKYKTK
jgi:hypothetical protein